MEMTLLYEAGSARRQRHAFRLRMDQNRLGVVTAMRFFEFWAQSNCRGQWRVEETAEDVVLSIARDSDVVHFRLTDLYERYCDVFETLPVMIRRR